MDVVYMITAHQNAAMLGELLDALSPARAIVHIDAKRDMSPFAEVARTHPNVRFTERRVDVNWGGWSQVAATLVLLSEALQHAADDDYLVLLSGDAFPLRPQAAIAQFLRERQGRQFIQALPLQSGGATRMPRREFGSISRISQVMIEYDRSRGPGPLTYLLNRLPLHRPFRRALNGRIPYVGSQWWALTGAAARWVLAAARWDRRFVRLCRTSAVPDEFFFQTLIMNSPHGHAVSPSLMYVDWTHGSGGSPAVLDEEALAELRGRVTSGAPDGEPMLFVRKVSDPSVARLIREELWMAPGTYPRSARQRSPRRPKGGASPGPSSGSHLVFDR